MSVNFKPLADRVLVEPVQAETKTASGIIIPDTAKKTTRRNCSCCWQRKTRRTNDSKSWR